MEPEPASLVTAIPPDALAGLERRRFARGDVVVAEGDYPGALYVVLTGTAEVSVTDRGGREHVVGRIAAGETIGEMSLFTGSPAIGTVRATEEVELAVLDESALKGLTRGHPAIYRTIVATLATRLARTNRLALRERLGRLVVIDDRGGPRVLARALAASVAWHTASRVAFVEISDAAGRGLRPRPPGREPGIEPVSLAPEALERALGELRQAYDHVLVRATGRLPVGDALVVLGGGAQGLALDGFRQGGTPPFRHGVVVPPLTPEDDAAIGAGLLGTGSAAGAAIGWLAREVSGLRVGVALGSGSLRGYAHLGALRALERNGIPVDCLTGTSIGAIVGAAYSYFRDTERVADLLDEIGRRVFRPTVPVRSLLSTRAVKRFVRSRLGDAQLEELPIPLAVVAADLVSQNEVVLERGSTVQAVLAASAIPGLYPPVPVGKRMLVDGSILNPVPVTAAAGMGAGIVVAIRLAGGSGLVQAGVPVEPGESRLPTTVTTILGAIEVVQTRVTTAAPDVRTVMVAPDFGPLPERKIRNFRAGRAYVDAGGEAIEAALPRLAAVMPWLAR